MKDWNKKIEKGRVKNFRLFHTPFLTGSKRSYCSFFFSESRQHFQMQASGAYKEEQWMHLRSLQLLMQYLSYQLFHLWMKNYRSFHPLFCCHLFIVVFLIIVFLIVVFLVIIFLAIIRCVFYESGKIKSGDCFAYLCRSSICVGKYFVESCKGSFVSGYRISSVSVKISYSLINLLLKLRFVSYKNCICKGGNSFINFCLVASSFVRTSFALSRATL